MSLYLEIVESERDRDLIVHQDNIIYGLREKNCNSGCCMTSTDDQDKRVCMCIHRDFNTIIQMETYILIRKADRRQKTFNYVRCQKQNKTRLKNTNKSMAFIIHMLKNQLRK